MNIRKGEEEKTRFRSKRFECINGKWFFKVREKTNMLGPYNSRNEAERAAQDYSDDMAEGKSKVNSQSHQYLRKAFSLKK